MDDDIRSILRRKWLQRDGSVADGTKGKGGTRAATRDRIEAGNDHAVGTDKVNDNDKDCGEEVNDTAPKADEAIEVSSPPPTAKIASAGRKKRANGDKKKGNDRTDRSEDGISKANEAIVVSSPSPTAKIASAGRKKGKRNDGSSCINLCDSDESDDDVGATVVTRPTASKNGATATTTSTTTTASSSRSRTTTTTANRQTKTSRSKTIDIPSFSICTYNVWFGPPHPSERMAQIASVIGDLSPRPVLVGLQEVTPALKEELYPLLMSLGYHVVSQDDGAEAGDQAAYGCAIAVLIEAPHTTGGDTKAYAQIVDSGFRPYKQTIMGRGLVWVHACITTDNDTDTDDNGIYVLFTTTHLESFVRNHPTPGQTYDGVTQRASQITQASQFCKTYAKTWGGDGRLEAAILTGDLNWDDERKRGGGVDRPLLSVVAGGGGDGGGGGGGEEEWKDVWLDRRPGTEGYTYDSKENPMLRGNLRRRFDRCLVWTNDLDDGGGGGAQNGGRVERRTTVAPHSVQTIGTQPIDGLQWKKEVQKWVGGRPSAGTGNYLHLPVLPSDHYGLCAVLGDSRRVPPIAVAAVQKKGRKRGGNRNSNGGGSTTTTTTTTSKPTKWVDDV